MENGLHVWFKVKVTKFMSALPTGPDQAQRQSGAELFKNGSFKEAFARFLMEERKKPLYGPILGRKIVYIFTWWYMHEYEKQGGSAGNRRATTSPMST